MDYEFILTKNCILQKQPPELFYEKRCSYKLHKIHKKTPVPESFFNKIADLRAATLLKKETLAQVLSCEFCKMSTNTLFQNNFGRPLLILFVAFFIFCIIENFRPKKSLRAKKVD